MSEKTTRHFMDDDAGTSPQASYTTDMAAELDTIKDEVLEASSQGIHKFVAWYQRKAEEAYNTGRRDGIGALAAELWPKQEKRGRVNGITPVQLMGLAVAAGLECGIGKTNEEIAKEIGCTRAAISKEVNKWRDRLKLKSRAMQSEWARDKAASRQHQVAHSKKPHSASAS